jgi:hypothetical protein
MGYDKRALKVAEILAAEGIDVDMPGIAAGEVGDDTPARYDRFLLIERNQRNTPAYYITSHTTPERAGAYHWEQETVDYDIELLVDLDTGDRYEVELRYVATRLNPALQGCPPAAADDG